MRVQKKKAVIILTEEEENFPSCRINSLHYGAFLWIFDQW